MKILTKTRLISIAIIFVAGIFMGADAPRQTHIVFLGDSLTDGFGVNREDTWVALLEEKLKQDYQNFRITNAGVSGATTSSGVQKLKWFNLRDKPDIVVLSLGSNDGLRGIMPGDSRKNLVKMVEYCQLNQIKVVLTGQKIPPSYGRAYALDFEEIFEVVAVRYRIPFYPFLLDGVAGDSGMNLPDGIHPNEEGHAEIAERFYQFWLSNLNSVLDPADF